MIVDNFIFLLHEQIFGNHECIIGTKTLDMAPKSEYLYFIVEDHNIVDIEGWQTIFSFIDHLNFFYYFQQHSQHQREIFGLCAFLCFVVNLREPLLWINARKDGFDLYEIVKIATLKGEYVQGDFKFSIFDQNRQKFIFNLTIIV